MSETAFDVLVVALNIAVVIGIVMFVFTPLLTLAERKISAWMQDRIGPNRAYIFKRKGRPITAGGVFHTAADALKLITKEYTVPEGADHFMFNLAPLIGVIPALVVFAVIPFGPSFHVGGDFKLLGLIPLHIPERDVSMQIANVNVGILFVFALGSLSVYGAAIAGWASNNKLALLGALRASAQTISYEVVFGLTLVGLMMHFGTVQMDSMVSQQDGLLFGILPRWGIFFQPLGFVLFFTAALAENKRIPFDLPEGESEIVGYFIEYSSMGFGLFMTVEFIEMVVIAFLLTTLFFGGYLFPGLHGDTWNFFGMHFEHVSAWITVPFQFAVFLFKVIVFLFLQFVIRWTLPRFRYDQLMKLGWRIMLPLALVNIGVTAGCLLYDPSGDAVAVVGLATIGIFILSLFYQRPQRAQAPVKHDAHAHGAAGH